MTETLAPIRFRSLRTLAGRGAGSHQFAEALRGVAVDGEDRLYAVGDSAVKVYDAQGDLLRQWPTQRTGHSIAVEADGRVWVGENQQVEVFGPDGAVAVWGDPGRLGMVTAIAVRADDVFLADANGRCIRRYTRNGQWLNDIGDKHRKGGFHIPNGVVDFDLDSDGVLHVANPGMHRVERYTAAGELLGHFGRFDGRDPAGFPGCCNPTNLAVDDEGRVIVTEKAGPRTKMYAAEGTLLGVIADDVFDPAAKNMDVAVDSRGTIYVADTEQLAIHVFAPTAEEASR